MNQSKDFKHLYQKYKKKYCLLKQKSGAKSMRDEENELLKSIFENFFNNGNIEPGEIEIKKIKLVKDYNDFIRTLKAFYDVQRKEFKTIENFSDDYITEIRNIKNGRNIIASKKGKKDKDFSVLDKFKQLKYELKATALLNYYLDFNLKFNYEKFLTIVDVNAKIKNAFELNKNKDDKINFANFINCLYKLEFSTIFFFEDVVLDVYPMTQLEREEGKQITSDNPLKIGEPVTITNPKREGSKVFVIEDSNDIKLEYLPNLEIVEQTNLEKVVEHVAEERLIGGLENFYDELGNKALLKRNGGKDGLLRKFKSKLELYNKLIKKYANNPALEFLKKGYVGKFGDGYIFVSSMDPKETITYDEYRGKIGTVAKSLKEEEKPFWMKIQAVFEEDDPFWMEEEDKKFFSYYE